jgi:hypothetical protein
VHGYFKPVLKSFVHSKNKNVDGASFRVGTLDELKSIIEKEVNDLKSNLEDNHYQKGETTERLMSRIAERNDMIRINTLRWVLDVIEKLEQRR